MDFLELCKQRWSCKSYSDRQVEASALEKILEAGRLSPTAKNLQEQHVYVAQSAEALGAIDQATPCRYGAPTVLVVAYDKENVYTYPDGSRKSGVEDMSIVATHLMLGAAAVGVDSCWINCFYPDRLHKLLGLPANEEIVMLLDLGYAAPDAKPLPNHFIRKPLDETVSYI